MLALNLVIFFSFDISQFRFIVKSLIALYHKRRTSRVALWQEEERRRNFLRKMKNHEQHQIIDDFSVFISISTRNFIFLSRVSRRHFATLSFSFLFELRRLHVVETLLQRNVMNCLLFNTLLKRRIMMNSSTRTMMNFRIALNVVAFQCFVVV